MRSRKISKLLLKQRGTTFGASQSLSSASLEESLRSILSSMASLLVASGFSYSSAGTLLKLAFVDAAADFDRNARKKANIARIAASTGLTRLEVAKLLAMSEGAQRPPHAQNRAMRVAEGWASDKQFTDVRGRPRNLKFDRGHRSFFDLAKRYSGDIPARALLREMLRLGLVVQDETGAVRLLRTAARISCQTVTAMRAISPWVDSLWSFVRAEDGSDLRSTTHQLKLNFDSLPQVMAALREFDTRKKAFVRSVAELGAGRVKSPKHEVRITIAIAATKPTKPIHGKKQQPRR